MNVSPVRLRQHRRASMPEGSRLPMTEAERLLLFGFRHWLARPDGWGEIVDLFISIGDPNAGGQALRGLKGLVETLNVHARRAMLLRPTGCPGRSADEQWLITMVSAAQAENDNLVTHALQWQLPQRVRAMARVHLYNLADGLIGMGHRLPEPGTWSARMDGGWHCRNCPMATTTPSS